MDAYAALARVYDVLVGDGALPGLIEAFETARRRHRIRFRTHADVGCGTGRFLQYMTRYPARFYGIDRSPSMLRIAQRRTRHPRVRFLLQDMRRLRLPAPVDLITVNLATMNYMVRERDLDLALAALARALQPGGALIFDFIPAADQRQRQSGQTRKIRIGQMETIWKLFACPTPNSTKVTVTIRDASSGAPRIAAREVHVQRWFHPEEIAHATEKAGLELAWLAPLPLGGPDLRWQTVAFRDALKDLRGQGSPS